jgi:IS5 family transposase
MFFGGSLFHANVAIYRLNESQQKAILNIATDYLRRTRWTVKNRQAYYGYKSHVHADVKHKLIQSYAVSAANVADNRHFVSLLSGSVPKKTPEWRVWADAAYHSKQAETALAEKGLVSHLIRRYIVHHPAYFQMQREMSRRTKIRKRVEHIFGFIENSMGGKFVRTIGLKTGEK